MAKWLLLDGSNLMFRAFYAIPDLTRSDGFPTNALHGWVRTLWKLEDAEQPDHMLVFFDPKGPGKRASLFPDYKANRSETPEELLEQIPWIKLITEACGIPLKESDSLEADDLIASAARDLANEGHDVRIVSADKDLGQLISPQVKQLLPPPTANPRLGWRLLDEAGVRGKYGIEPGKIRDYLALIGDSSDNIPGIHGVGPKTASRWLQEWESLEGIIEHAHELKPSRFQSLVAESVEMLRLNYELVGLDCSESVDLSTPGEAKPEALIKILESMEMRTAARDATERYRVGYLF
ncbi:MAG: 5'-3' exonuclease H3TH domain-containing protein [Opitutales bacterium]|tara:strand:- start:954 stop:1835 length:882 start_codon:yes stop_codon:yes gene_type:complete